MRIGNTILLFCLLFQMLPGLVFGQFLEEDLILMEKKVATSRADCDRNYRSTETSNYDIVYHRLDWNIHPAFHEISGSVFTTLISLEDNLSEVKFDIGTGLIVTEVTVDGVDANFSTMPHELSINLPDPFVLNSTHDILVTYFGEPNTTGFGSFQTTTHETVPILFTLSEPYGAREWWPCKQDLNDKVDSVDIFVRTPIGYKVASNGVLKSVVEEDEQLIHHWSHKFPIPAYLIGIAVTNYVEFTVHVPYDGEDIEILNYVYPEYLATAQERTENMTKIMLLLCDKFGIYPFHEEKYGHAQWEQGGGMEHTTMSFMNSLSNGLVTHELAHQWFGNKITCGSWQDIWLNEGFATYCVGLYYESEWLLDDEYPYWRVWREQTIDKITVEDAGSVFVKDTADYTRIFSGRLSYSKGAYLLHMLRWEMGDEPFYTALRNYINDPDLAFSYADTDDLVDHLETQYGSSLSEFFDDWFYGEGYPSFDIEYVIQQDELILSVQQSQSHSSVDFYEMTMPIVLRGDGMEHSLRVPLSYNGQYFNIPISESELGFEVEEVLFDPELWILSADNVLSENSNLVSTDPEVQLFPNPVVDRLSVKFTQPPAADLTLEIFDNNGKKVLIRNLNKTQLHTISMTDLSSGKYEVVFRNGEGIIGLPQSVVKE